MNKILILIITILIYNQTVSCAAVRTGVSKINPTLLQNIRQNFNTIQMSMKKNAQEAVAKDVAFGTKQKTESAVREQAIKEHFKNPELSLFDKIKDFFLHKEYGLRGDIKDAIKKSDAHQAYLKEINPHQAESNISKTYRKDKIISETKESLKSPSNWLMGLGTFGIGTWAANEKNIHKNIEKPLHIELNNDLRTKYSEIENSQDLARKNVADLKLNYLQISQPSIENWQNLAEKTWDAEHRLENLKKENASIFAIHTARNKVDQLHAELESEMQALLTDYCYLKMTR